MVHISEKSSSTTAPTPTLAAMERVRETEAAKRLLGPAPCWLQELSHLA